MQHSQSHSPSTHCGPAHYNNPEDTWYCTECGTLNMDWVDLCPACGKGTREAAIAASQYYGAGY
ncbi:hypothetical protein SVAN01_02049 [Stagonosporopsis vannaccii]|nr:hypothetical protein SVAN01_02049 [Stagonosporopsis vannaccii]